METNSYKKSVEKILDMISNTDLEKTDKMQFIEDIHIVCLESLPDYDPYKATVEWIIDNTRNVDVSRVDELVSRIKKSCLDCPEMEKTLEGIADGSVSYSELKNM